MRFLLGLFLFVCLFFSAAHAAHAADEEDFVFSQLRPVLEKRLANLEKTGPNAESIATLGDQYFDTLGRLAQLESNRAHEMSYYKPFWDYLKGTYLPKVQKLAETWHIPLETEKAAYEQRQAAQRALVTAKEEELKKAFQEASARDPQLPRIFQLTSMLRSDTLGQGKIGSINPTSADQIQNSTKAGLVSVLDQFDHTPPSDFDISITALQGYQGKMLGKAEHMYSRPGRINDIHFKNDAGNSVHVRELLKDFEKRYLKPNPSLNDAFEAYQTFLHYHPFGDSNGRAAELIKQVLLARQGLPPLITREKTAVENFYFQRRWGASTTPNPELLASLDETSQYLKLWEGELKDGWKIENVDFSGQNMIVTTRRGTERRALVSTKMFETKSHTLPPVRSAPVVADVGAQELKMRVSVNGWKSYEDIAPTDVVHPPRIGSPSAAYVMYSVKLPPEGAAHSISFAYYYPHPFQKKKIWFNNSWMNYNGSRRFSAEPGAQCEIHFRALASP